MLEVSTTVRLTSAIVAPVLLPSYARASPLTLRVLTADPGAADASRRINASKCPAVVCRERRKAFLIVVRCQNDFASPPLAETAPPRAQVPILDARDGLPSLVEP